MGITCSPVDLVMLFLPRTTKDKLLSQFSPTFTLKDGEPVTFIYAASLYALSTVAFVRSVEYIGSGLAATAKYLKQVNKQSGGS